MPPQMGLMFFSRVSRGGQSRERATDFLTNPNGCSTFFSRKERVVCSTTQLSFFRQTNCQCDAVRRQSACRIRERQLELLCVSLVLPLTHFIQRFPRPRRVLTRAAASAKGARQA